MHDDCDYCPGWLLSSAPKLGSLCDRQTDLGNHNACKDAMMSISSILTNPADVIFMDLHTATVNCTSVS